MLSHYQFQWSLGIVGFGMVKGVACSCTCAIKGLGGNRQAIDMPQIHCEVVEAKQVFYEEVTECEALPWMCETTNWDQVGRKDFELVDN